MFESISELKTRVKPVLKIKEKELKKQNINISSNDIFTDLVNNNWKKQKNLHLCDIVNDIINYQTEERDLDETE